MFLYFVEMEVSGSNIKDFQETETLKNCSYSRKLLFKLEK